MKKLFQTVTAATIAAVLFSCGNGSENTSNTDTTNHENHGDMASDQKKPDTAEIKEGQSVFFENLKDGQEIKGDIIVKFGLKGMRILPADSGIVANAGHHHLLIDTIGSVPAGVMVPMGSPKILHFGKGQTESKALNLAAGKHKLTIQFANGMHQSYGVKMSKTIEVIVK